MPANKGESQNMWWLGVTVVLQTIFPVIFIEGVYLSVPEAGNGHRVVSLNLKWRRCVCVYMCQYSGSRMLLFSDVCNERGIEPNRQDLLSQVAQDLSYYNGCWLTYRFVLIHGIESMSPDIKPGDLSSHASCRCSMPCSCFSWHRHVDQKPPKTAETGQEPLELMVIFMDLTHRCWQEAL